MAYELVICLLVFLLALVVGLLSYYGNIKNAPWYSTVTCIISWWFPFAVIVIMPLDLTSTLYQRCLQNLDHYNAECDVPHALVSEDFLMAFWSSLYWVMFNLTWWFIPLMISYIRCGEFEFWPKMKLAIVENIIFYGVLGGIGVLIFVYMLFALNMSLDNILNMAMAAANAYGLLMVIGLLGYGLATVPRQIWDSADIRKTLHSYYATIATKKEQMGDAEADMYAVARDVALAGRKMDAADPLRRFLEKLTRKCPMSLQDRGVLSPGDESEAQKEVTRSYLVRLHDRINAANQNSARFQAEYKFMLVKAYWHEDLVEAMESKSYKLISPLVHIPTEIAPQFHTFIHHALWAYYIILKPFFIRLVALICVLASLALVWSETTFQVQNPTLSIPALILQSPYIGYGTLQLVSLLFMLYMCVCVFASLFKVNVFGYYFMVPEHNTDPGSLLFVGSYLCRLMFPLCYNFLNMVSDPIEIIEVIPALQEGNSTLTTTATVAQALPTLVPVTFTPSGGNVPNVTSNTMTYNSIFVKYQGKAAQLTPLFGDHYDQWLPELVLIMAVLTLVNSYVSLFGLCGVKGGMFGRRAKAEANAALEEGRSIIASARSADERYRKTSTEYTGIRATTTLTSSLVTKKDVPKAFAKNTKELLAKYGANKAGPSSSLPPPSVSPFDENTPEKGTSKDKGPMVASSSSPAPAASKPSASSWTWFSAKGGSSTPLASTDKDQSSPRQKATHKGGFQRLGWDEKDGASNL